MSGRRKAVLVAVAGVLVLSGCSKSSTPSSSPSAGLRVIHSGQLTVGSCLDLPPLDFLQNNQPTGFDVELLNAVAGKLGLKPVFVKTNFDTIFTSVASGKFDVASSGIVIRAAREEVVSFTIPYLSTRLSLVVDTGKTPRITTFASLKSGDVVGVQKGSVQLAWAQENLAPKGIQIKTYADYPAAYLDLQAGRIPAVVGELISSTDAIKARPELKIVENVSSGEKEAFAVSKGNPQLKAAMDKAIQELFADGTFGNLFQKYFPGVPVPTALP